MKTPWTHFCTHCSQVSEGKIASLCSSKVHNTPRSWSVSVATHPRWCRSLGVRQDLPCSVRPHRSPAIVSTFLREHHWIIVLLCLFTAQRAALWLKQHKCSTPQRAALSRIWRQEVQGHDASTLQFIPRVLLVAHVHPISSVHVVPDSVSGIS